MPGLTLRRLAFGASAALLIGGVALTLAVAFDALDWPVALFLAFAAAGVSALAILGVGLRRFDMRTRTAFGEVRTKISALETRAKEHSQRDVEALRELALLVKDVHGAVGEDRVEMVVSLAAIREKLHEMVGLLQAQAQSSRSVQGAIGDLRADASRRFEKINDRQVRLHDRLYAKVEAHADLRDLLSPRAPMPLLGGWAIDVDVVYMIFAVLWERRPGLIVECGSGSSTVWLGYMAERIRAGRVVALEHNPRFLNATRDLVRAHNLEGTVDVRQAPLQEWTDADGATFQWYAQSALDDLKDIGFLLVDGPPAATGPMARYPAGPLLLPRCADDAVVLLDDATRDDERALSDRWVAEWPEFERTKGAQGVAHFFRRRPVDDADQK